MREGDAEFEALREAIDAFAEERVPDLVAEARAEALGKVRSMLADAIAQSLLEHAGAQLGAGSRRPAPAPRSQPRGAEVKTATQKPAPSSEPDGYYVYGVVSAADADLPP